MHPNRSNRRVHNTEFKSRVLAECRQPGASVAAVAISHGLNPNVVRKWLSGRGLKRTGLTPPALGSQITPVLQFVPVELANVDRKEAAAAQAAQADIRIELQRGGLQVKLLCAASSGPSYAALLRALADAVCAG